MNFGSLDELDASNELLLALPEPVVNRPGSAMIPFIGGQGGASAPDIYHSDYGGYGSFNCKLTRSGNTFTVRSGDEFKLNVLGIGTLSNY